MECELITYSYFGRGGKLDYPNNDTNKASKKYVKAMRSLQVRNDACLLLANVELNSRRKLFLPGHPSINNSSTSSVAFLFTIQNQGSLPKRHCNIHGSRKPSRTTALKLSRLSCKKTATRSSSRSMTTRMVRITTPRNDVLSLFPRAQ